MQAQQQNSRELTCILYDHLLWLSHLPILLSTTSHIELSPLSALAYSRQAATQEIIVTLTLCQIREEAQGAIIYRLIINDGIMSFTPY